MYLIKTYLDKSPIHGIGVYAGEDVAEGTVIWSEQPGFDQILTEQQVAAMPTRALEFMRTYAYFTGGKFHLNSDNGKFTNHDDDPNSRMNDHGDVYACRVIAKGDEITADYAEFAEDWPPGLSG